MSERQPVGISPEHKLGCEIQFDAECNCRDDDFEIDRELRKVWGVGDKTRPKIIEAIRPYLRTTKREVEQPVDYTCLVEGLSVSRELLKEQFPNEETHRKVLALISLLQVNAERAVANAPERESVEENEEEHMESCECCQSFLKMEKRYDHLRGYPQDEESFVHEIYVGDGKQVGKQNRCKPCNGTGGLSIWETSSGVSGFIDVQ